MRSAVLVFAVVSLASAIGPFFKGVYPSVTEFGIREYRRVLQTPPTSTTEDWLVLHYSSSCGHCRAFAPVFAQIANRYTSSNQIRFGAVNLLSPENQVLIYEKNIEGVPLVEHFQVVTVGGVRRWRVTYVVHSPNNIDALLDRFYARPTPVTRTTPSPASGTTAPALRFTSSAFIDDALSALSVLLRTEVFRGSATTLSLVDMGDLVKILTACEATLNEPSCSLLRRRVEELISKKELLTKVEWDKQLLFAEHVFKPLADIKLKSCETLTCAQWRLFHIFSIGKGGIPMTGYTPKDAMEAIRVSVDKFFSCVDCRTHFLQHYDGCDFGRCLKPADQLTWKDTTLWLWRFHNAVTKRVHPARPQWPSQSQCSSCFTNDDDAYKFLVNEFGAAPPVLPSEPHDAWPKRTISDDSSAGTWDVTVPLLVLIMTTLCF